jgi:hypothetical protein
MKLIAGLIALVSADVHVTGCNAGTGGAAAMSMEIDAVDVQRDLKGDGWTLNQAKTKWNKTVPASAANTVETGTGDAKQLVFTHKVDSAGCKEEKVGTTTVCTKIGHELTFTCTYPMKNQDLVNEKDFTVSGSDTEKNASNTGKLGYKLTVDTTTYSIGSAVTATITPDTANLVHATIESCSVKNKDNDVSVTLIKDGMNRECKLGVSVTDGQGDENLSFKWNSFKWSTTLGTGGTKADDENQELSCNISLSKAKPTDEPQQPTTCPSS